MARHTFTADVHFPGADAFNVCTDADGTTTTDILTADGTAIDTVEPDQDFQGPDGVTRVWLQPDNDSSVLVPVDASDSSSGAPVEVHGSPADGDAPVWSADRGQWEPGTVSSGSSSPGQLCWFETGSVTGTGDVAVTGWEATTDGVAAFTDAAVGTPNSKIVVANGGAWHFDVTVALHNQGTGALDATLTVALNDDSVGPLYDLTARANVAPTDSWSDLTLGFDCDLADDDVLVFTVHGMTADLTARGLLTGRRIGAVAA